MKQKEEVWQRECVQAYRQDGCRYDVLVIKETSKSSVSFKFKLCLQWQLS